MARVNYVLTFIAHGDQLPQTDEFLKNFTAKNNGIELEETKKLSQRALDQYFTSEATDLDKDNLVEFEGVDIVIQRDDEYRHNKKLVVFDMDSTLIYQEVIELIAAYANVEDKVREITNRAMNNEIDFKESLMERVSLLKGLEIDGLYDEIKPKLELTRGVEELCRVLRRDGIYLAVLSGGFIPFAEFIQSKLQLDYARANTLETDSEGKLTGMTLGEIVDGECKASTILELCAEQDIPLEASMMVGDGGNDLPAMGVAGFGIAWNAKPRVQALAPAKLNTKSLRDVLYILGYTDAEINV